MGDDIPRAHFEVRKDWHIRWVILTAYRTGGLDPITVEMPLGQWLELPVVQYVVKLETSQQQPRTPRAMTTIHTAELPVPRGHLEWKEGRNWVVLTANRLGSQEAATVQ